MIAKLKDFKTLEFFRNGETEVIPNFRDDKSKSLLVELKPNSFIELCNIYSLNREITEKSLEIYKNNIISNSKIEYCHPILEKELNETYGIIIYSEQIENVIQNLANISSTESVKIRKELAKRNATEIQKYLILFKQGCLRNQLFIEQCSDLKIDAENCVNNIWSLINEKAVEVISFAYVLNCVSESYLQAMEIAHKKELIKF